ncbi:MAG: spore coat U domain-containing protein [Nitrospiraceae bacterium]|nr:spore coat U domain-containing protein [Nitrospiraceae bacterium]
MKRFMMVLMAAVLVLAAGTAMAATATSVFAVSATVQPTCSISTGATAIAFGTYDPLSATPLDGSGTVSFRCTRNTLYWTYIPGPWTIAGPVPADVLSMNFYSDAAYTALYSTGKVGGGTASPNNAPQTVTYYGRIPANQYVAEGAYSQNFTFTVEY